MEPLISLELRWFLDGPLPRALESWFREVLPGHMISTPDRRDDVYLHPARAAEFGVKLREGKLEVKWRERAAPYSGPHRVQGQMERWLKWTWGGADAPAAEDLVSAYGVPRGPWLTVAKTRWQRKYRWEGEKFAPAPAGDMIELGVAIEIAELRLQGRPYSTVLVECYAPDAPRQEELLNAAVDLLWRACPTHLLKPERSYGYPRWIGRFGGENKLQELIPADYKYLTEQFVSNEAMGEKRVALFVSLTAGLGAAAVLAQEKLEAASSDGIPAVLVGVNLAWLLLGVVTLQRIVHRNTETDKVKAQLDRLRRWYVGVGDEVGLSYLPYDPYGAPRRRKGLSLFKGNGGYAELVGLINAMVAAALGWQLVEYAVGYVRDMPTDLPAASVLYAPAAALLVGIAAWMRQDRLALRHYGS